ncbi:hypothetical protein [Allohahella marinimesophila]|uniref:Uncharacterized protein n=1 Tax=Allohahella marinimesophila TaxID=1054972 RepID=A0ABP7NSX4_9GAMM
MANTAHNPTSPHCSFPGLRTGVHNIGGGLVDGTFFDIYTSRFDEEAPPVGPQAYPSEGSLTIDSLDRDRVSGSFEMIADNGEKIQGNFDLNLR